MMRLPGYINLPAVGFFAWCFPSRVAGRAPLGKGLATSKSVGRKPKLRYCGAFLLVGLTLTGCAQLHPNLILTKAGVETIREAETIPPLFQKALETIRAEVDAEIAAGIDVPVPKDMAGGYTHERHKRNFFVLQKAGNLYQITGEDKYARYVRDLFLAYAELYPTLGLHPTNRSYATGKIFWQCLNDANWLVYSAQAYDAVYDFLTEAERRRLETQLFRPLADFISLENPKFFNRIHNHSTWGNAAVGMIGLAMNDEELIERALYGIQNDGLDNTMLDNDGGFIKVKGQNQAGFLAQLDYSFSPDGYFTEGPYYLRYAMTPFLLFARALHNERPALDIYNYRDRILEKAVFALLQQADARGHFFPINDAQKGMSWNAREVVAAVDIAYHDFGRNPMLLSIAERQGRVLLDETGFVTARDLARGLAEPFKPSPVNYRDGAEGSKGGVAILRADNAEGKELALVLKYSAHGMGHGHFDKLSYSIYDDLGEVVQDYGAARWVNIDQKGGGRYLPENNSFAKQSVAHNTVVVDEESHYGGSVKRGEANSPALHFFETADGHQIVSARDMHAYADATLQRTVLLLQDDAFRNPVVLDLFRVASAEAHRYDLPLWFAGHLLSANFDYTAAADRLLPLGTGHGYQHLWHEATGTPATATAQLTWLGNGRFYTLTAATAAADTLLLARAGANDPAFNLRHDPTLIQRKHGTGATFFRVIESHGRYNPVSEIPLGPFSGVASAEVLHDAADYTVVAFAKPNGTRWTLAVSNQDAAPTATHTLSVGTETLRWTGPYHLSKNIPTN